MALRKGERRFAAMGHHWGVVNRMCGRKVSSVGHRRGAKRLEIRRKRSGGFSKNRAGTQRDRLAEMGRKVLRPSEGKRLGAEEDGFALEHFYRDEERDGGVDARGREDDGD
jgi:hypothetical protein